jgi:hypothetical protein
MQVVEKIMARTFDIERRLMWCKDTCQMEPRLEVTCGIATNLGTVLVEKRAFVKTAAEAFALRAELDADCLDYLRNRAL